MAASRLPSAPRLPAAPRRAALGLGLVLGAVAATAPSGCFAQRTRAIEIRFAARIGDAPFSCAGDASAARGPGSSIAASDLRFFVHGVELLDARGRAVSLALEPDGRWQSDSVALLDFEDGAGACANGTPGTHTALRGRVPEGEHRGLRFVVGVPFSMNHGDPATASPPLTLGQMSWGWQAGYKFLRFEGVGADGEPLRLHLGSTGCEGTFAHVERCLRPNRAAVALPDFVPGRDHVVVDLAALLPATALPEAPARAASCISDPSDRSCAAPFAALGLELESGEVAGGQRVFREVAG